MQNNSVQQTQKLLSLSETNIYSPKHLLSKHNCASFGGISYHPGYYIIVYIYHIHTIVIVHKLCISII